MKFKLLLYFLQLRQWSTFGTLEVEAQTESQTKEYSVITEEDCEILKISAKNYARFKSVRTHTHTQYVCKLKLSFAFRQMSISF